MAEMAQLETAIDSYKAAYGFYPPSNPLYNPTNVTTYEGHLINPLYYELLGTTNINSCQVRTPGISILQRGRQC